MAKGMTKSDLLNAVAEKAGVTKKEVDVVLNSLEDVVKSELKSSGQVTIPGLLKLSLVQKPAVPEREGINPFTKEPTVFKAKPASNTVKARPIKALKDAVA